MPPLPRAYLENRFRAISLTLGPLGLLKHFLELLVAQGANGQLDEHLLTPLQIATLAASTNSSRLLLRTIKNMVEVYLTNKDVKKSKKSILELSQKLKKVHAILQTTVVFAGKTSESWEWHQKK